MANKNNIQTINFNGALNLNKYQCEIKNFDGFNKKNSSIFGGVLTPFFDTSYTTDYFGVNNKIYHINKNYDSTRIALYKGDTLVSTLPKYSISKKVIKIEKNILAFELDSTNRNIVHLFVEGETKYQFIDYNISTDTIINTSTTTIDIGNVSICDMIDQTVVFYDYNGSKLYICNKQYKTSFSYSNSGSAICTINRLNSTFDKIIDNVHYTRYLISYCGKSGNINSSISDVHNIVGYVTSDNHLHFSEVTLVHNELNSNQIPKFAPKVYDTNPTFYYVTDLNTINESHWEVAGGEVGGATVVSMPVTTYMTATPASINENQTELTVTIANPILVANDGINTENKCSAEITPYFCSILIGCSQNKTNVYFDSVYKYFIGNTGYIKTNDSKYVPYGHKVDYCDMNSPYKFSILMNYTNVSNISVTLNNTISGNRKSNIGTIVNEWNSIDGRSNIYVNGNDCMFKNTNNDLIYVSIAQVAPEYNIIADRYILFRTPHYMNVFDTEKETFYHAFTDYNNRMILCEKYGDTSISDFPTTYALTTPNTFIYASAINANMEISNIYISSIEYNPFIVENGRRDVMLGEFVECGEFRYNEKVDAYWTASSTATTANYRRSYTTHTSFYDNSLSGIPYPITSNGNILYSTNIFSEFINSYSNNDYVINNRVGYPLVYINNQPTLNYYFLTGIENVDSAFILQGTNYINTNTMIFSVSYNGDVISYTEPLVSIQGFKFLGNTTKCAFYFSYFTKCVYGFLGDRTLNKLIDCSAIENIINVYFNPKEYKIYVVTEKDVVVMDEETMYAIDIPNVTNISFTNESIILNVFRNNRTESEMLTYHSSTNKNRIPLKLKTQYYGIGNNIKSIIDCIYIRLFNDYNESFNIKGDIKLHVNTITDCGKKSEEKIFSILPSDWDKETRTFYIRYQPKYQECVGMEVDIESPFALATLDFGYSTDGTAQVSKYNV